MERPFSTYRLLTRGENSYFIGANSESGFILAENDSLCEEGHDRVFIIKGGPGTGKSTFMNKAAEEGKKEGYNVEYFYCSSDPDSLDAVVVSKNDYSILIIDGTNPHVTEMKYPGTISEIINISSMWETATLEKYKEEIFDNTKRKSLCFESAYKYLSAASQLHRSQRKLSERVCDFDKMSEAVSRFCYPFKKMLGKNSNVYTDAFSMKGTVAINHYFIKAESIYYLSDNFGLNEIYIDSIAAYLEKYGVAHVRLVSPINSNMLNAVYIIHAKTLVVSARYSGDLPQGKNVNMKRFLNGEESAYKGRYRFGVKCENALFEGAFECLAEASKYHFELEDIYKEAMSFRKLNRIYSDKIASVLKNH